MWIYNLHLFLVNLLPRLPVSVLSNNLDLYDVVNGMPQNMSYQPQNMQPQPIQQQSFNQFPSGPSAFSQARGPNAQMFMPQAGGMGQMPPGGYGGQMPSMMPGQQMGMQGMQGQYQQPQQMMPNQQMGMPQNMQGQMGQQPPFQAHGANFRNYNSNNNNQYQQNQGYR